MKYLISFIIAGFFFGVGSANATLVTSMPGATVIPFPTTTYNGGGPQSFGPGIIWSSTNYGQIAAPSIFGYYDASYYGYPYDFFANGSWNNISMAGLNDSTDYYGISDTMTFEFNSPVMGVGGLMNYMPLVINPTISVYDSSHSLIESTTLNFFTGGGTNSGQFFDFMENSDDIKYFELTDAFVGITNLTVANGHSTVPEPTTLILFGIGLGGMFMATKKRYRSS